MLRPIRRPALAMRRRRAPSLPLSTPSLLDSITRTTAGLRRHSRGVRAAGLLLALGAGWAGTAAAQADSLAARGSAAEDGYAAFYARHPWVPRLLGAQFTYIGQDLRPFAAAYSGPNSLTDRGDFEGTHTYGVYVGASPLRTLQVYVDAEMARGAGVGHAVGLAGLNNGDVIRQGSIDLGMGPYLARAFLRYVLPLGRGRDTVERGLDAMPGPEPTTRLQVELGKFALSDYLDLNRYANSTRTQFENWGLWNNTAWDFAADTRGYTNGLLVGYVSPAWMVQLSGTQMPTFANGNIFDGDLRHAYAINGELTVRPQGPSPFGTAVRLLAYLNRGRMGIYRAAIDRAHGAFPSIVADDRKGRAKYGFGLNVEQPLADSGNTGLFARLGWNDGRTEDFVFTEADRHASLGVQLAGAGWRRPSDRLGLAVLVHGLSGDHAAYLAAGGLGFLLGDRRLDYGPEEILEAYYRFVVPRLAWCDLSPDYQFVDHPGYNRARGPAHVIGIRLHLHY